MSLLDNLLGVIAPHFCLGCGAQGDLLCFNCADDLPDAPKCCHLCRQSSSSPLCSNCCTKSSLEEVRAATAYEGVAKALVWQLKYNGAQAAVNVMARHMRSTLQVSHFTLVPVPTASSRVRRRGYDQAKLLALELSKLTGLPCAHLLKRRGHAHQVGAARQQRMNQLQDAFQAEVKPNLTNVHPLLIDDVLTTGATLEAAARTLRKAGVRQVSAVTFAQTLV